MRINWKVRFKNKTWLASFTSMIIGFVYGMLSLFDVFPDVTQATVTRMVGQVLEFLGLIGVLVDPTTEGLNDSKRAMTYDHPWNDETDGNG